VRGGTDTRSARESAGGAPFFVSLDEVGAYTLPYPPEGDRNWTASAVVRDCIGQSSAVKGSASDSGPQAFLVEVFPAQATAGAHFHDSNQFQIFYPAAGAYYKRHAIERPLLHYADAYSSYGPFGAREYPLAFYTLRQSAASLTAYMPRDRDRYGTIRKRGRNITAEVLISGPVESPEAIEVETLIEAQDDGLAAYSVRGGPSATITLPSATRSGGQYLCVLSGLLVFQGKEYPARSLGWSPPDSCGGAVVAGESGVHALIMQFPRPA
jgi:hypothetical protein